MRNFGNIAEMAVTSRMWWAFARDKAIPVCSCVLKVTGTKLY